MESVTLELPESLATRVRETATRTQRQFEEVILDWLERLAVEPPLEALSDQQILALCHSQLPENRQEELQQLLQRNREGQLSQADHLWLDELMHHYRRGLVRKAQALKIAVERGLLPPIA